ncbi:ribonuclease P protein component [uncultured Acetobacteroides sp.]|uniref:ribonuclease P protein component n=1 Tax=uncultured Acetobacteroides sp. TaxID=1760811 RepID=UPI0029F4DD3D|nr:ribonuclease P protein component [uncultured Acetobacteroides sp.]
MKENRFYKTERLCSKKDFEQLFTGSNSFFVYPFKVVYRTVDYSEKEYLKIGISVSKRNFKRAVKRNYIKRRIREAFRLNKGQLKLLLEERRVGLQVVLVYVSKETQEYADIEPKIKIVLERLAKNASKDAGVDTSSAD